MESHKYPELERLAGVATTRASEALSLLLYETVRPKSTHVYFLSSPEMLLMRLQRGEGAKS